MAVVSLPGPELTTTDIAAAIPASVHDQLRTLWANGHAAYVVGGSLRDVLLGRDPEDWDLTTSARPEVVQSIFADARYENAFGTVGVATNDEAVGVIGPNGAGKTTALNVLAGRLRPDRGRVLFAGRDITALPAHARSRAGIALTHQIPHPFPGMTVFENVLVGATHGGGRPERAALAACADALELAGLIDKANAPAGVLTLLERKRLEREGF